MFVIAYTIIFFVNVVMNSQEISFSTLIKRHKVKLFIGQVLLKWITEAEAHSEPIQTSKMELFAIVLNECMS